MAEYIERSYIRKMAMFEMAYTMETETDAAVVLRMIDDAPAADVAPVVHGRWEWFDEDTGTPLTGYEREWDWRCSRCKHELPDDYDDPDYRPMLDYCPNCGARMDGGDNDAKSM